MSFVHSLQAEAAVGLSSPSPSPLSSPSPPSSFSLDAANAGPQRKLVPFLKKMQTIIAKTPRAEGEWSPNGLQYNVLNPDAFALAIQSHFKSSTKTFCRQLFYYGFSTIPARDGGGDGRTAGTYSIYHPLLQRDDPSKLFEIKRLHKSASDVPSSPSSPQPDDLDHVLVLQKTMGVFDDMLGELRRKVEAIQQIIAQQPLSPKRLRAAFEAPPAVFEVSPAMFEVPSAISLSSSSSNSVSDNAEFEFAAASAAEAPNAYNWRAWEVERAESSVWDLDLMDIGADDVQWSSMLLSDKLDTCTKQA